MKQQNKILIIAAILSTFIYAENPNALKEAFNEGMKSAINVMISERSQSLEPIKKGYCIAMSNKGGGDIDNITAINLEALAIYMKMKSSYLSYEKDGKVKNLLCFAMTTKDKRHANELLTEIRNKHTKIDQYVPIILKIDKPSIYTRIIPAIGEWHQDQSASLDRLSVSMASAKRVYEDTIKQLRKKLQRKEKDIKNIEKILGVGGSIAPFAVGEKNNTKTAPKKIIAKKLVVNEIDLKNGTYAKKDPNNHKIITIESK